MKPITTKELQMLTYIKSYALSHGYLPSVREIGEGVGLRSSNTVWERMHRLENLGYIERDALGEPRAYRVKGLRYVLDE